MPQVGENAGSDHFRAIFLQLNRRLNLLNVVDHRSASKELEKPSRRTQSAGISTSAELDFGGSEQFDEGASRRRA